MAWYNKLQIGFILERKCWGLENVARYLCLLSRALCV